MITWQRHLAAIWLGIMLIAPAAHAHTLSQPPHQSFNMGDLRLKSCEVIRD
ncbi:MAG: hypothetical protein H7345_08440 [Rubritepida sp.]|nr:hypothetical protein [Rubritepida sp.]